MSVQVPYDNLEYQIIWHLSSPMDARLMEFYCKNTLFIFYIVPH